MSSRDRVLKDDPDATARGDAATIDPSIVWHYTDGPGLLSILRHDVLWATSAAFLNDQSEIALGEQQMAGRVQELAESSDSPLYARLAAQIRNGSRQGDGPSPSHFFIVSASQSWDSLAMWRLYGGVQESYAIGLDAGRPLSVLAAPDPHGPTETSLTEQRGRIYLKLQPWEPVRYTASAQRELVDAVLDDLPEKEQVVLSAMEGLFHTDPGLPSLNDMHGLPVRVQRVIIDLLDDLEQALLLIKHEGFVDERETRSSVILWDHQYDEPSTARLAARLVRHRSTSYGITPYLELTGAPDSDLAGAEHALTETRRPLPIRAVAISPSANGPAAALSLQQVLRAHGYDEVPVLRSRIPFRG